MLKQEWFQNRVLALCEAVKFLFAMRRHNTGLRSNRKLYSLRSIEHVLCWCVGLAVNKQMEHKTTQNTHGFYTIAPQNGFFREIVGRAGYNYTLFCFESDHFGGHLKKDFPYA